MVVIFFLISINEKLDSFLNGIESDSSDDNIIYKFIKNVYWVDIFKRLYWEGYFLYHIRFCCVNIFIGLRTFFHYDDCTTTITTKFNKSWWKNLLFYYFFDFLLIELLYKILLEWILMVGLVFHLKTFGGSLRRYIE